MNRLITRKLEMAARVQEFQRAHPYSDRNQAAVAARFEESLAQAQPLYLKEHAEQLAASAITHQRQDLRRGLEAHLMRSVARIGAFATRGDALVASRFTAPPQNSSNAAFLARASSLLEVARAHQEALTSHGLTRGQLSDYAASLTRFRAATADAQASRRQHRETRATLQGSIADLTELLSLLDVFNRSRFQVDAGLLSMWTSLRKVGRARRGTSGAASEVPATPRLIPPAAPSVNTSTNPAPTVPNGGDDEPPLDGGLNRVA